MMSRRVEVGLLALQLLVAVVALGLWQLLATVPVFGRIAAAAVLLLQSGRCRQPDRRLVRQRRDLEASGDHAVGIDPRVRDRLARRRRWSASGSRASRGSPRCSIPM